MKKILIADDDPAIVDSVSLMLEMGGYEVMSVMKGDKVRELKENAPDLLLLDIWMSGEDGREICKFLKSQKETKNLPIILFSASKDISQSAKAAGADDFIPKPFDMESLLGLVSKYIRT